VALALFRLRMKVESKLIVIASATVAG